MSTPAELIKQVLVDGGVVNEPAGRTTEWPIFVSYLPDDDTTPGDAVCIYDTSSVKDGRLMQGKVIEHHGFMIHVRAQRYPVGYAKAKEILAYLDAIRRQLVSVDSSEVFLITSVNRMGGVNPMGREPSGAGSKRRELFSINALLTLVEAGEDDVVLIWDGDFQTWNEDELTWDQS